MKGLKREEHEKKWKVAVQRKEVGVVIKEVWIGGYKGRKRCREWR